MTEYGFVQHNRRLIRIRDKTRREFSPQTEDWPEAIVTQRKMVVGQNQPLQNYGNTYSFYESTEENIGIIHNGKAFSHSPELIYSIILHEKVSICSYQTARLNETYCVCGRGLKYQQRIETII